MTLFTFCSEMMLYSPYGFASNRIPWSRQLDVLVADSAGSTVGEAIVGISDASAGPTLRSGTVADDRMMMTGPSGLAGRANDPVNLAPACRTISSPGCAAFNAA